MFPSPHASRIDIGEIHRRAAAFRKRLNGVKRKFGGKDLKWYPYDTLLVFSVLERMLTGERRYFAELAGSRPVLDIGCGDGDMAFFLESLGCRVDAVDFPGTNFNQMRGVKALKQAQDSSIGIFDINLDQPFELPRSGYGLTICLGLLYHLKNPYYLLETLARATHYCLLSTRVARLSPDHRTSLEEIPVAYLLDESEANNDPTNFWIFSETGLRRILNRTGWQVCDYLTTGCQDDSDPSSDEHDQRAFCLLRSPVYDRRWCVTLLDGWHPIESGHFRWTERRFSVRMETAGSGACSALSLAFFLPDEMGAVTLSGKINGRDLPPQVFSRGGECKYRQPVPPGAVTGGIAEIELTVDRSVALRRGDERELGVVVSFAREGCALCDSNLPLELE